VRRRLLLFGVALCIALVTLVFWYLSASRNGTPHSISGAGGGPIKRVQPPAVPFREVTREAGIDFVHDTGHYGEILFPEVNGPGCGFIDFDNDGDQDVFLVNSGKWPHKVGDPEVPTVTHSLYRNDGHGRFEDIGAELGLKCRSYGIGACFGDVDNDGFEDIYIVCVGPNALFRNAQGKQFTDIARDAGVECHGWSNVAAFLDYDRDGLLDLFVGNYVKWSVEIEREVLAAEEAKALARERESARGEEPEDGFTGRIMRLKKEGKVKRQDEYAYVPGSYEGTFCNLYRNLGGPKFRDVSKEAGIHREERGGKPVTRAMGVGVGDYDDDGWPDIVVANDDSPDYLFRNIQGKRFQDVGFEAGIAAAADGEYLDSMGVQWADFRNDGTLSVTMGHYGGQGLSLLVPQGREPRFFIDRARPEGLRSVPISYTNWGHFFFDYDLDGRLDFLVASGHVSPGRALILDEPYRQRTVLLWNSGGSPTFILVQPEHTGPDLSQEVLGRGAVYGDIENDGDLDVLVATNRGPAHLFRNELEPDRRYVRLKLLGTASNRSAIGAKVRVRTGKTWQQRAVCSGGSYSSQSELPLTFGLGDSGKADEVVVWWPSGKEQIFRNVPASKSLLLKEGGALEPAQN